MGLSKIGLLGLTLLSSSVALADPREAPYDFSALAGTYVGDCTMTENVLNSERPVEISETGMELQVTTSDLSLQGRVTARGQSTERVPFFRGLSFERIGLKKNVDRDCEGWFIGHTSITEYKAYTIERGLFGKWKKRSCFLGIEKEESEYFLTETPKGFEYKVVGKYRPTVCTFERRN